MLESKLQKALKAIQLWQEALACPLCGGAIDLEAGHIGCGAGHRWDVNRKGYVNLLNRPHATYYDRQLFEARSRLFNQDAYAPVVEALMAYLKPGMKVLDAGCGEGFYLDAIGRRLSIQGAGIDISRDAVAQAACHEQRQLWLVGDVTRLPFQNGSLDVILDILTPASYQSFWRVLKPQGVLLKVYPGGEYLKELRGAMGLANYQAGQVAAYAGENARIIERQEIKYTLPLTAQMYRDFVFMTPLTQRLTQEEKTALAAQAVSAMTIHLFLDVMQPKG